MYYHYWIVLSVGLLCSSMVFSVDILDYECSEEGVITIVNPNATLYIWAQANSTTFSCNTTLSGEKIIIYDCFNQSLTMILNDDLEMPALITDVVKIYHLGCLEIPGEGVVRKVVDETHITHYVSTSIQPTIIPTIVLNTTIKDVDTGFVRSEAEIGETFAWYIIGPEQYKIVPEECTVYSGPLPDTTVYSVDTHTKGCTLDDSLIMDFRYYNSSEHIVVAEVYTFRFPNSDQVTFHCNVRGCPLNSTSTLCELNCSSSRKKREDSWNLADLFAAKPTEMPRQTPTPPGPVMPGKRTERSISSGLVRGKVHISLRIIGEPNIFIEELRIVGTSPGLNGPAPLTILLMLVFTYVIFH